MQDAVTVFLYGCVLAIDAGPVLGLVQHDAGGHAVLRRDHRQRPATRVHHRRVRAFLVGERVRHLRVSRPALDAMERQMLARASHPARAVGR